ncbi:Heparanase-like protein 2 [Glycine soja]|uniref:Heparanase-like protein 2 n=1 Tax=Glycine soja TaxID=3848 RepID=A0A0B2NXY8_GLYSO|nr:Heparanase-like protein 2 [Glycine soja]
MDLKVTLCYVVLLLLFSLSSAEDVKLEVKGVASIANTDDNFICATLDWWPANKCDYDQCPWGQAGILNLDLDNKILTNAVKAFNPLRIRLGGSLEDQIVYQFGKQKKCPHFKKKADGLFGFSQACLPKVRWDEVNDFFNKTGVKLIFGLNALTGKRNSAEDKKNWVGNWNPKNAISLMKYTISKGYKIDSYELGNELCAEGISARVDSVEYAKDITRLRHIVNLLYPIASTRPKVLGPGGFYGKEWFSSFLMNVGPGVVDGITHHIYNLGAGVDKDLINRVQDPYLLSQVAETYKSVAQAVKEFTPWAGPWVGESGGAYNSGGKDVPNTFVNGFWYLDQLGMTSTLNHKVYCRQTLIGGNYGLLNTTTFIPNPDYYGALLWHRLMGSKVLSVSHEGSPFLRTYAHCSKKGPGITVLLINMSNSTTFNVFLINDMNLYPVLNTVRSVPMKMREEYHLTPRDGNIQSDVVMLNGTPLVLTKSLDIAEMKPKLVDPSSSIKAGPDSIVFVQIKSFNAPACA